MPDDPGSISGIPTQDGGDPGYPSPWATDEPREGLRDNGQAHIVCLSPSVNLTPVGGEMVAVPYMIYDVCDHPVGYSGKTFYTGQRVLRYCDKTAHVHGDEAGTGGGVVSGTVGSVCEPIGNAPKVRVEGSMVVRHLDRFWMENRNTIGEAVFVRELSTPAAPPDDDPIPGSARLVKAGGSSSALLAFAAPPGGQAALLEPPPAAPPSAPLAPRPPPAFLKPPPEPPPLVSLEEGASLLERFAKWGGAAVTAALILLTPTNGAVLDDVIPQDDFERQVVKQFNDGVRRGADSWKMRDWAMEEIHEHRRQLQTQRAPAPAPQEQQRNVRISRDPNCRTETICFDKTESPRADLPYKFDEQLRMRRDALNAKTPEQVIVSIPPDGQVGALRGQARPAQRDVRSSFIARNQKLYSAQYGPVA